MIFNCDNRDCINQLQEGDLIVTDPPYAIGQKNWKRRWYGNNGKSTLTGTPQQWDQLDVEFVEVLSKYSSILWGGNFYPLRPSRCWFVWDKLQNRRGADCELAWANLELGTRVFRMSRIDAYFNRAMFKKKHPAEKPVQLFQFCIEEALTVRKFTRIVDPYMGTGNCGVAAMLLGLQFLGYERDVSYFTEAQNRIEGLG